MPVIREGALLDSAEGVQAKMNIEPGEGATGAIQSYSGTGLHILTAARSPQPTEQRCRRCG
jgi:hypothetical protein